jgi:hypothetical protein
MSNSNSYLNDCHLGTMFLFLITICGFTVEQASSFISELQKLSDRKYNSTHRNRISRLEIANSNFTGLNPHPWYAQEFDLFRLQTLAHNK